MIVVEVERIADACGYGVPLMSYEGEREHAEKWAEKKLRAGGEGGIADYMAEKNTESIDGLPAFDAASGSLTHPPARALRALKSRTRGNRSPKHAFAAATLRW